MSGILSFFTLFLSNLGDTVMGVIWGFLLSIDAVAYSLVAYSFKVFNILCTLNFNSLYGVVAPLIDRIQVVMIVFIVFQLGMALLKYLLNPDELQKDGTKLVKNIFIATALFVSYNFVFSVMNELNIALMGNSIGYRYTTIGEIFDLNDEDGNGKNDPGLIMRFIFGSEGVNNGEDRVGESIALSLAGVFIKDVVDGVETDESGYLYGAVLKDGSADFSRMEKLGPLVADGRVKYTKLIGFVVCLFVVYSVFSASIQVGVRMFKLVILQMVCPLVIVDVIKNGIGGKLKKFGEVYISVFIEAFVRMLTILIITVFVSKFLIRIDAFFPQLSSGEGIVTKGIIMVIIVISAYTFAGQIPKFIDDVLGTKMSSGKTGNFVGSVLGAGLGAIGGFAAGLTAGGLGGAMTGAAGGLVRGGMSGGKGDKITDFFKNNADVQKANREKARAIARQGGTMNYLGERLEHFTGRQNSAKSKLERLQDNSKAFDNMVSARTSALENVESDVIDGKGEFIKYGSSADEYASKCLQYDQDVNKVAQDYEKVKRDYYEGKANEAQLKDAEHDYLEIRDKHEKMYKSKWNDNLMNNSEVNKDKSVIEATNLYDKRADKNETSKDIASGAKSVKEIKQKYAKSERELRGSGAISRADRQSKF